MTRCWQRAALSRRRWPEGIPVEVVFYTNGDNNEFAYLFYRKAFTLEPGQAITSGQTRALEGVASRAPVGAEHPG